MKCDFCAGGHSVDEYGYHRDPRQTVGVGYVRCKDMPWPASLPKVDRGDMIRTMCLGNPGNCTRFCHCGEQANKLIAAGYGAVAALRGALTKARDQFRLYERLHREKGSTDKAERNAEMARMCDEALGVKT